MQTACSCTRWVHKLDSVSTNGYAVSNLNVPRTSPAHMANDCAICKYNCILKVQMREKYFSVLCLPNFRKAIHF